MANLCDGGLKSSRQARRAHTVSPGPLGKLFTPHCPRRDSGALEPHVAAYSGCMITNPRTAQRRFRVRNGVIFSLGFRISVRVVQFE